MIKISVIIPLFNKEQTIKKAVESVLEQTFQEFELIIVDDGSTDNSFQNTKSFSDPRIKLSQQTNAGVSAARNLGVENAQYDYVAFLDGDDTWEKHHLETICNLIAQHPNAGAYSTGYNIIEINHKKRRNNLNGVGDNFKQGIIPDFFKALCLGDSPIMPSNACILKKILIDIGLFPLNMKISEDIDTWTRIALKHPMAYDATITMTLHRETPNRATLSDNFDMTELPYEKRLLDAIVRHQISSDTAPYVLEFLARYNYLYALHCLLIGKIKLAQTWITRSKPKQIKLKLKRSLLIFLCWLPHSISKFLGQLIWNIH